MVDDIQFIRSIRGMKDYLPKETIFWHKIENILKMVLVSYGYSEIKLPIIEKISLFKRAIGEVTNVVEKEMYTFSDRNGDILALRPEGTAGCVRAGIQHGILHNQEQRLWYAGPMFRHERPQKGRYRQFYQIGVEVFKRQGPDVDAELIMLANRWWKKLGISKHIFLHINSIGSLDARKNYNKKLVSFLSKYENFLDKSSRRCMYINPMRIFDTKNLNVQSLLNDAPIITDYLDDESRDHFKNLCKILDIADVPYIINPRLVRGLDYYNQTVFEWVTSCLGSQDTICGGGRYDKLVKHLGGKFTPAIGFAVGLDRLVLLVQSINPKLIDDSYVDIYLVISESYSQSMSLQFADKLRNALPNLRLITNYGGGSIKKQFYRANKSGARMAIILKENYIPQLIDIKDLITGNQKTILESDAIKYLISILK